MATETENNNEEEQLDPNDNLLSRKLVKNITGLPINSAGDIKVYGVTDGDFATRQNNENNNVLRPNGLQLNGLLSNAKVENGIVNFTAYNDYIHYDCVSLKRWNAYANIAHAAVMWQIYDRNYR